MKRIIAGAVAAGASCPAIFQRSRRGDLLLGKHMGYLGRSVPDKAKAVYLLHHGAASLSLTIEYLHHVLACGKKIMHSSR